jgi:hypothetical protein
LSVLTTQVENLFRELSQPGKSQGAKRSTL